MILKHLLSTNTCRKGNVEMVLQLIMNFINVSCWKEHKKNSKTGKKKKKMVPS